MRSVLSHAERPSSEIPKLKSLKISILNGGGGLSGVALMCEAPPLSQVAGGLAAVPAANLSFPLV